VVTAPFVVGLCALDRALLLEPQPATSSAAATAMRARKGIVTMVPAAA